MRITNSMTSNKMLLNINRNSTLIDKLYTQYTTGKKIQNPSDNPIIASRALKFRTNVSMTEQYMRNVSQGISWMKITEQGFSNTQDILKTIRERCDGGATDTFEYADRQKIATEIRTLVDQIGSEMNIQYAGRYVYSGYKTDEPPIVEEDSSDVYSIEQKLTFNDIEKVKQYTKSNPSDKPEITEVFRLKLPYNSGMTNIVVNGETVNPISFKDPVAYSPDKATPPAKMHYIQETGEIIMTAAYAKELEVAGAANINISYQKTGLSAGELNPRVYFKCTDTSTTPPTSFNMDNQDLKFEFGVNTRIKINNLAKDVFTPAMYADLRVLCDVISNVDVTSDVLLQQKYATTNPAFAGKTEAELKELKEEQITQEEQIYRGVMQDMFSNMLSIIDRHASNVSTEETNLGSRIVRLNLIQERLEADRVSYTDLMSENENVDYLEVLMNLKAAESVYNAALKAGSNIMQMSLADFIR